MRLITLIATTCLLSGIFGQVCKDNRRRCHKLYCRFFPSVRRSCRKTCGLCRESPITTTRRTTTTTTTTPTGPVFDSWTVCSRSCDAGTRFRVRRCSLNDVERCPRDYQDCNTRPCPTRTCRRTETHRYNILSDCCSAVPSSIGQCGVRLNPDARIIGGTPAAQGQWPWMVRLEKRGTAGLCGGALLSSEWIVTAAHCVNNFNANQIAAFVGYGTLSQTEIDVENIIIHPNFNIPLNDIALIKLSRPAFFDQFVQQICLPNGETSTVDKKCFIAGWGVTNNNNPVPSTSLQEARLRILPYRVCNDAYQNRPFAGRLSGNHQICAGSIDGKVDSCFGDSGGPIMCQRCSSCAWYVAGIVSIGPLACGTPNEPGVYTKVLAYEPWIRQHVTGVQRGAFSCL